MKKDSLIKGTLILAAAALVARFLGIFQRIPLEHILLEEGMAHFAVANTLYLTLLVVATGGIPSAISKLVSERYALQRPEEAHRIYQAALLFGLVTGVILTGLLYAVAPFYAVHIAKTPGADLAIRAVAPTLLIFPVIAMMRGYFQGRQLMSAGGISQIVEQILRVIVGVGLAILVLAWGWGDRWAAASATFGNVLGGVGAFLVMLWFARKLKRMDAKDPVAQRSEAERAEAKAAASKLPYRSIYREIFKMSIPVVITAMTVQLIYMFDTSLLIRLTEGWYYKDYRDALSALTEFSFKAQSIAGIPPILAIALSTSIIPVISSAYSLRNMGEVQRQTSLVMRIVLFTGIPIALTLTAAAYSVTGFLFSGPSGSGIVAALTAGTVFQITMMTSNSILFGLGKARQPMKHTFAGIGLKLVLSVALAPLLGVYGLILSSTICFIVITWLNLDSIRGEVKITVLGRRWLPYLATILIAIAGGWGTEIGVRKLVHSWPDKLEYLTSAAAAGIVIVVLYLALLIVLRVVTMEDAKSFPGPLRKLFMKLLKPFAKSAQA
ncbi:putative polysaccharide biosynthesis protein [Paenibacillus radicis (ex Gao et al. 2016)]|uniref:Stage V sporulation protein B n=1 Tax=Paenibacillus radicis (ex Gao et al. 2016) TaxID=1737354 RepID=A0A917HDQ8_9BACL|nr:polysaccharide biosynthesis protein [Paenibacillus radicis (ex Gao et al. 2016)]GGG75975.1 stage V sporulation protein B [Paenibacillus radicis (ex Gao et al. 2016)]